MTQMDEIETVINNYIKKGDDASAIKLLSESKNSYFMKIVDDFVQQDISVSFEQFYKEKMEGIKTAVIIGATKKFLGDSVLKNLEKPSDQFTPYFHYHTYFRLLAGTLYGFKCSSWKPEQGVSGLMSTLKKEGAVAMGCAQGGAYYNGKPKEEELSEAPYIVQTWEEGQKKTRKEVREMSSHVLLIVGAEKAENDKTRTGYVYFIDPNDASDPRKKRKIGKISYEDFVERLDTLQGLSYSTIKTAHPEKIKVGFCADQKRNNEIIDFYQAMKADLGLVPKPRLGWGAISLAASTIIAALFMVSILYPPAIPVIVSTLITLLTVTAVAMVVKTAIKFFAKELKSPKSPAVSPSKTMSGTAAIMSDTGINKLPDYANQADNAATSVPSKPVESLSSPAASPAPRKSR